MSHYKPYPAYRDSGVEWMGEVPEHWTVQPVKHLYSARLGKMVQPQSKSDDDVLVPYHRAQTVQWERIEHEQVEHMWASPSEVEVYSLEDGDLLICEGGDVCRAAIFSKFDNKPIIFQNSIHRVRPLNGNQPEWLLRLMQIVRSSGWIDVLCSKNTIVHFTSDKLASLNCPCPPLDEQQKIITALRGETSRIDALIAKKIEFIELLTKKRQALISHAVTKGLNPKAKMKDSGVEWIGEVPEHWGVSPFKWQIGRNDGGVWGTDPDGIDDTTVLRSTEQTVDGRWRLDDPAPRKLSPTEKAAALLADGDLVVTKSSGSSLHIGKTTIVTPEIAAMGCCYSNFMQRIRLKPSFQSKLAWYVMNNDIARLQFDLLSNSTTGLANLNGTMIGQMLLTVPPISEQSAIVAYLDRETARIDALIAKTQHSIDLLKKRRSALITAAVTGQIDLRGAL
jgi:type I restriction enzyme S subunit